MIPPRAVWKIRPSGVVPHLFIWARRSINKFGRDTVTSSIPQPGALANASPSVTPGAGIGVLHRTVSTVLPGGRG